MPEIRVPAIRVEQPLGAFVAFSLPARRLLPLTFAQEATLIKKMDEGEGVVGYGLFGTQRRQKPRRLDEISRFIQSTDATFPNAIILAANYDEDGRLLGEDRQWRLERIGNETLSLVIPDGAGRASIIDGQHRLMAFNELPEGAKNRDMELLCVAFLDLPSPFHAFVFATINFNQVKVDRSLAYQLFGFQVEQQEPIEWVPETTAVAIGRLLASSDDSPFNGRIASGLVEGAEDPRGAAAIAAEGEGPARLKVSMATVVDGILKLITRNPRRDRDYMRSANNIGAKRGALPFHDEAPLRPLYILNNDRAIYETVRNYFIAIQDNVWDQAPENSYLLKTVGIQAEFDVLRILLSRDPPTRHTTTIEHFQTILHGVGTRLNREPDRYQASGIGRTKIREDIIAAIQSAPID